LARSTVIKSLYRHAFAPSNVRAIFQTEEKRAAFLDAAIVTAEKAVVIQGSGTSLERFNPKAVPEQPPIVLMVSRLLRQKGVREFVEAARILRKRGIQA